VLVRVELRGHVARKVKLDYMRLDFLCVCVILCVRKLVIMLCCDYYCTHTISKYICFPKETECETESCSHVSGKNPPGGPRIRCEPELLSVSPFIAGDFS
jgi:hypothetical protein